MKKFVQNLANTARSVTTQLSLRLLPPVCVVCGLNCQTTDICTDCARALPWNDSACARCATPLAYALPECGACLSQPPAWARAHSVFQYNFPIASLIQAFKYRRQLAAGRVLSELSALWLSSFALSGPDLLVPVPLHFTRQFRRQFNQSEEIARILGERLNIKVARRLCSRSRRTEPQSGLPLSRRQQNLRSAFCVRQKLDGLHVTIIDDVLTTGATAAELSRCLYSAGARRVDLWTLARAASR